MKLNDRDMDANYSLNVPNVLDFLRLTGVEEVGHESLHYYLGIPDDRARVISTHAYNLVWDEIEGENFSTIKVIGDVLRGAMDKDYNDTELIFYLYWAFAEIDSYLNPTIEINFEEDSNLESN